MARVAGGRRLVLASLAVIALAVVVGAFFLGARARAAAEPHPAAAAPSRPSAVPTRQALTATPARRLGPADLGPRSWDALTGGECLGRFASAWALRYDVVACRSAHTAQLTRTVALPDGAYPGRTALRARLGATCQESVRLSSAARYADLRVGSSYPTAARWATGDRTAYCFVSRAGGGSLTGTLAAARG